MSEETRQMDLDTFMYDEEQPFPVEVLNEWFLQSQELAEAICQMRDMFRAVVRFGTIDSIELFYECHGRMMVLLRDVVGVNDNHLMSARIVDGVVNIVELDYIDDGETQYIPISWPTPDELKDLGLDSLKGEVLEIQSVQGYAEAHSKINENLFKNEGGANLSVFKLIDDLYSIFKSIEMESSNNRKIELIRTNAGNNDFVETLKFVYDDYVTTGMSYSFLANNTQIRKIVTGVYGIGSYSWIDLLNYVKGHNTGTLETTELIRGFAMLFDDLNLRDFIYKVFGKNLKVGITAKSINKALGKGTIKEFSVQLAHPYYKYPETLRGKDFVITQKLDGHRAVCIVQNGTGKFYSRKGLEISGLGPLAEQVAELSTYYQEDYVFDGELLLDNHDGLATKDLFRATSRVLRSDTADKTDILFNVFDALPLAEFQTGESSKPFLERKSGLLRAVEGYSRASSSRVRLVNNLYEGNDLTKIKELQESLVKPNGWEGLMVNLAAGKYQTKRTTNLLKVKRFHDADLRCSDVFEGTGRLKGSLGGIIVNYKGSDVRVGTGFTLDERDHYWEKPDDIVGRIVQVQYFEETNNQNDDGLSLRFPVFQCIRDDKDEASYA